MQEEINIPVWVKQGGMWYNRYCLSSDHPESVYNYIKNTLNENPEDFGFFSVELTEEQRKIFSEIPTEALMRELDLREQDFIQKEAYGDL